MNRFVSEQNSLTIVWTKWKDVGMQSNIVLDYDKELFWPIEERDALKVFDDIMDCNDPSIVVGGS